MLLSRGGRGFKAVHTEHVEAIFFDSVVASDCLFFRKLLRAAYAVKSSAG